MEEIQEKMRELLASEEAYTVIMDHLSKVIENMEMDIDDILQDKKNSLKDAEKDAIRQILQNVPPDNLKTYYMTVELIGICLLKIGRELEDLPRH